MSYYYVDDDGFLCDNDGNTLEWPLENEHCQAISAILENAHKTKKQRDDLLNICKEVASMAGIDWLKGQLKLCKAIANVEKS